MRVLAVDPGSAKCGLALVEDGTARHREIVSAEATANRVRELVEEYAVAVVVVGDATGSKPLCDRIREVLPGAIPLCRVSEVRTSERARARYLQANPPQGWERLLPAGLRTPSTPYDDYAAVILAEDWLASRKDSGG